MLAFVIIAVPLDLLLGTLIQALLIARDVSLLAWLAEGGPVLTVVAWYGVLSFFEELVRVGTIQLLYARSALFRAQTLACFVMFGLYEMLLRILSGGMLDGVALGDAVGVITAPLAHLFLGVLFVFARGRVDAGMGRFVIAIGAAYGAHVGINVAAALGERLDLSLKDWAFALMNLALGAAALATILRSPCLRLEVALLAVSRHGRSGTSPVDRQ